MTLHNLIPDIRDLNALEAEEVAGALLQYLHSTPRIGQGFHPSNILSVKAVEGYPKGTEETCLRIYSEGWSILEREGMIAPILTNPHGSYFLTRRGMEVKSRADFSSYRLARLFPKDSVHPLLAAEVYPMFLRGMYEAAVFQAFKLVEIEVRDLCPPQFKDMVGTILMNHAFRPGDGPLTNPDEPEAEKEALMSLFRGAIGRFKNPGSHRRVPGIKPTEAIEMIQFASLLLGIVVDRNLMLQARGSNGG